MANTYDMNKDKVLERFHNGKEFTEEVLNENKKLRQVIAGLKAENRSLQLDLRVTEVGVLKERLKTVEEALNVQTAENRALLDQFAEMEEENRRFSERYISVEKQVSDLISLYVAAMQLHASMEYREVITVLKDIVLNLIGAEEFAIYLREPTQGSLRLIAQNGSSGRRASDISKGDRLSREVLNSGEVYVRLMAPGQRRDPSGCPIVCIPLKVGEEVFGVVTIQSLLCQKEGFMPLDFELFDLLGRHAAVSLLSSKLYALRNQNDTDMSRFFELIDSMSEPPKLDDPCAPFKN